MKKDGIQTRKRKQKNSSGGGSSSSINASSMNDLQQCSNSKSTKYSKSSSSSSRKASKQTTNGNSTNAGKLGVETHQSSLVNPYIVENSGFSTGSILGHPEDMHVSNIPRNILVNQNYDIEAINNYSIHHLNTQNEQHQMHHLLNQQQKQHQLHSHHNSHHLHSQLHLQQQQLQQQSHQHQQHLQQQDPRQNHHLASDMVQFIGGIPTGQSHRRGMFNQFELQASGIIQGQSM